MDACQRTMEHLTASGILTYKPGVATGKCRAPYVVVRGGGAYARGMSGAGGNRLSDGDALLLCAARGQRPAAFVAEVRRIMRGLKSQLRPTGNEGIEMLEEDFDARMPIAGVSGAARDFIVGNRTKSARVRKTF